MIFGSYCSEGWIKLANFLSEKINNTIEKIAFILLNILVADLCIFGAGRLLEFGPLTFRMVLLLVLFAVCIPLFIRDYKSLLKSNYVWAILIFGLLVVVSTVVGAINNNRINLIATDIKGFVYFAFLPCVVVLINSYKKIVILAKTCMYAAAIQGLTHIVYICLYISNVPWLETFSRFCDERRFFYVSYRISDVNVRVSFLSSICLLLGVVFSIYFGIKATSKLCKIIYPVITAICGFSLLMSYTRSVFLAVGVTVLGLLVFLLIRASKKERYALLIHILITLIVFSIIIAGFNIKTGENYFTYALSRTFIGIDFIENLFNPDDEGNKQPSGDVNKEPEGTETTEPDETIPDGPTVDEPVPPDDKDSFYQNTVTSDSLRALTVGELVTNIKKSPIIGLGLGAEIASRPDGLNEYFFLDLFSKMGIIGLVCYLSPLVFMLIQLVQLYRKKHKHFLLTLTWFCVLLGLVAYSYFTPCMNSSVGIMAYCCIIAVFEFYRKSQINLED